MMDVPKGNIFDLEAEVIYNDFTMICAVIAVHAAHFVWSTYA